MEKATKIIGVNPVKEALEAGKPIEKILLVQKESRSRYGAILQLARQRGVPVQYLPEEALSRKAGTSHHQGVLAIGSVVQTVSLEELLDLCRKKENPLLVALDRIQDPQNLGAILRSAEAAGFCGAVLPARRSAPLSPTVTKTSAGAVQFLPIARVGNLNNALRRLKEAGYWIVGSDQNAEMNYWDLPAELPLVVVIGSEGEGMHHLTRRLCDYVVKIPMHGKTRSLNASAAAAVLFFDIQRKRALPSNKTE
jgi:23S rRNA (guanosine2251-2'-O)-methyltransferase